MAAMERLDGKVAIVTGGASGIGRASARALVTRGAAVAVADLDLAGARLVADEISADGAAALAIEVDVSEPDHVERMVRETVARLGGLDTLVNNAATVSPDHLARDTDVVTMDLECWERTMAVNLRGPMLGCRFAIPELIKRGGGSIVNTSSAAAGVGDYTRCAYGTSKGGVNSLTRYVAAAYGKRGVRCNAIAPGAIDSPALRGAWRAKGIAGDDVPQPILDEHMLNRIGQPEDIAELVVFLASEAARHLTGQVIVADGGFFGHSPYYSEEVRRRAGVGSGS